MFHVLHIRRYDDEQIGTPENDAGMTPSCATPEARASQRLLMGPWGQCAYMMQKLGEVDFVSQARQIDLRAEQARWFDRWLKNDEARRLSRLCVSSAMGERLGVMEQERPLARAVETSYYLRSGGAATAAFGDGTLSTAEPEVNEPQDSYRYRTACPTPFITEATSVADRSADDYGGDPAARRCARLSHRSPGGRYRKRLARSSRSCTPGPAAQYRLSWRRSSISSSGFGAAPLRRHGGRASARGWTAPHLIEPRGTSTSTALTAGTPVRFSRWYTASACRSPPAPSPSSTAT